jgi:hypothetical protein
MEGGGGARIALRERPRATLGMQRTLSGLLLMVTTTWALLLGETFVFFSAVRPLAPNIHESLLSAALKVGTVVGLLAVWVVVMFLLEASYSRRVVRGSGTPAPEPQK